MQTTTMLDPTTLRARIRHLELQRTLVDAMQPDDPNRAARRRQVDQDLVAYRKQLDAVLGVSRLPALS